MSHFLTSWKSTVQGLLTGLIGLPTAVALMGGLTPKEAAIIAGTAYLAKQVLAGFQQDADKALATTPNDPTPHAVDASPKPLDPQAVVKES